MELESVRVRCPKCGVTGESDPRPSRWQCGSCGSGFFLRRCSACSRVSFVDAPHGFKKPWPCTWCGEFNSGFSQNRDPAAATVAELAAELALHGEIVAAPEGAHRAAPRSVAASGKHRRRRLPVSLLAAAVLAVCAVAVVALHPKGSGNVATTPEVTTTATASVSAVAPDAPGTATASAAASVSPGVTTTATPLSVSDALQTFDVAAAAADGLNFQGVPGDLTIVGTSTSQVTLTGQLRGAGAVTTSYNAEGVLRVAVTCTRGTSCTGTLRLAVPQREATDLHLPGGSVNVTGLAGALSISATNANVTASGLSSPSLMAAVTNGQLNAAFTAPPRQVSATLTSSHAMLRLPASVTYRVIKDADSGSVSATVPQSATATHTVTATVRSGELALLPS